MFDQSRKAEVVHGFGEAAADDDATFYSDLRWVIDGHTLVNTTSQTHDALNSQVSSTF